MHFLKTYATINSIVLLSLFSLCDYYYSVSLILIPGVAGVFHYIYLLPRREPFGRRESFHSTVFV